ILADRDLGCRSVVRRAGSLAASPARCLTSCRRAFHDSSRDLRDDLQCVCSSMLLTVSKRLEFSASRRLHVKHWSDRDNLAAFGHETDARYGTGRNYVAYFVFTGPVDPSTGML